MNPIRCTIVMLALFMSLATFQITGCGSSGGGEGSGVTIGGVTISASEDSLPADGFSSLTLTIRMTDDTGSAVALGTKVTVTTTLGSFSQNGAQTLSISTPDSSGTVTVSLIASNEAGTAVITAEADGVTQRLNITFTPSVDDPGVTQAITLTANPTSITADGQSSTIITVTMTQADGSAVGKGATVELTTDRGTFGGTGGAKTITLTTEDTSGTVIASLISSTEAGVAVVTAISSDVTQLLNVVFTSGTDFIVIDLQSDQTSLVADGVSSTAITVTLTQASGAAVPVGTNVTLTTNLGKFDMTGTQEVTLPTLDNSGTVKVSLIAGQTVGSDTITATAGSVTQTMTITFTGVTDNYVINMTSAASELPADGSSSTAVTVAMTLTTGAPVEVGTVVSLTTSHGSFNTNGDKTILVATADATGVVVVSIIAGVTPAIASIVAEIPNAVTQRLTIKFLPSGNFGKAVGEAFGLAAEYHNITGLTHIGLIDSITAYAANIFGTAVQDNLSIRFKTNATGGSIVEEVVATDQGSASAQLVTIPNPPPQQGFVSVTAETEGDTTTRVTALAVAPPPNQHIMYAGTNGGGVYKSVNGGGSWESFSGSPLNSRHGQNFIDPYVKGHSGITIDPDNPNVVYVGTGYSGRGNIYRSLDGGLNWNSANSEEWLGLDTFFSWGGDANGLQLKDYWGGDVAVLTVLADGDENSSTDYPYVWAGTEGRGFIYASDGTLFRTSGQLLESGPTPGENNTGNGFMSTPVFGLNALSETWTAVAFRIPAGYTTPVQNAVPYGNGAITGITTSPDTVFEQWVALYQVSISDVTSGGVGSGTLSAVSVVQPNATSESFFIACVQVDDPNTSEIEPTLFSVTSSIAGDYPLARIGTYNQENVSFTINEGIVPFAVGDWFRFSASGLWQVTGSESGVQDNFAYTDVNYTSDTGVVGFLIVSGTDPYGDNDTWTFFTTGPQFLWRVTGSQSGLQENLALNDRSYTSDNLEVSFQINSGDIRFEPGDTFTFQVSISTLNHGRTVWDIVKVPDTHGPTAILYAGTDQGLFKSRNGGVIWSEMGNFVGDSIGDVALHPSANGNEDDILYVGTHQAGVWVSTDSGQTWVAQNDGIDDLESSGACRIRDILVDTANRRLYAIGLVGPPDAGDGKVYMRDLNENGTLTDSPWVEAKSELPDPMWPPHVLAADNPRNTTQIFMGTEGINLYTATEGILTGEPVWKESKTGIDNTIMARIPILFSGAPDLRVDLSVVGCNPYVWKFDCYFEDVNGNPPIVGSTFTATYIPRVGSSVLLRSVEYGDWLTYWGTFRDRGQTITNKPFTFRVVPVNISDRVEIIATTPGSDEAPGGNGTRHSLTFTYGGEICEEY